MTHEHHQEFTCPMHPEVIKDKPGKCPKCGMNLIPAKQSRKEETKHGLGAHDHHSQMPKHEMHEHDHKDSGGHVHHAGMIDDFKKRFYIVLGLTIPIMALSPMIQHWLNIEWSFQGSNYLLLGLSSVVFFYGGWPFLQGFVNEIKS